MSTPEKEPISDWTEDGSIIAAVTQAMREADPIFETTGGGTRHYVRDLLLPIMHKAGLIVAYADKLSQRSPGLREHAIAFGKWTNNSWYTPHYAKWIHLREGLAGMKTTEELYGLFVKCPEGMPALSMDVESAGVKEVCGCGRTLIPVLDKSGNRIGVTHETTEDEEHHSGYFRSLTVTSGSTPSAQPIEEEQDENEDPVFGLQYPASYVRPIADKDVREPTEIEKFLEIELAAARTEITTQTIQIAGLLASNKEWGDKYAEARRQVQEAKDLIEGFVRIWRAEGNKGGAPKNIKTAIKFLSQFPQPPQTEK